MHLLHRIFTIWFIAVCAAVALGCTRSEPQQSTPETAVLTFYSQRIASGIQGTPSVDQLERLAPYISAELRTLLEEALLQHHKISSHSIQSKRTFVEGDLFSSLFDGPTSFATKETRQGARGSYIVTVQLMSAKQLPALKWTDQVTVIEEDGRFVVADIEYGNHWAFGNQTSLIASLNAAMGKRARKHA
jgi:hypothetical protein